MSTSPDYIGESIDAIVSQKVKVFWKNKDGKDEVCLVNDYNFFSSSCIKQITVLFSLCF